MNITIVQSFPGLTSESYLVGLPNIIFRDLGIINTRFKTPSLYKLCYYLEVEHTAASICGG